MSGKRDVTYDRPVKAALVVRLDNGDEWEATAEDIERFGYREKMAITRSLMDYERVHLGAELVNTGLNPVRYLYECLVNYDHLPLDIAADIKALIAHLAEHPVPQQESEASP